MLNETPSPTRRQVLLTCSAGVSTLLAGCVDTRPGGGSTEPLSVSDSSVVDPPENTPSKQGAVVFNERPAENAVVIGAIVMMRDGCDQPTHSITEDESDSDVRLIITSERPDSFDDDIACTAVIQPQQYGVRLEFNSLQVGGVITVAVDSMGRVEYELSGEDTEREKRLRIPEVDGAVQPSTDT